jgi:DNA-binding CsgD family transcriptional regulator
MSDYRVRITVKNNLLLKAIESSEYGTSAAMCRKHGICASKLSALINLKCSPIVANTGNFCEAATQVMDALCALPEDLWSLDQLTMGLSKNYSEKELSKGHISELLDYNNSGGVLPDIYKIIEDGDMKQHVATMLHSLTEREADILCLHYGLYGKPPMAMVDIARIHDLSQGRIQQIINHTIRKLRNPKRSSHIEVYSQGDMGLC